MRILPKQIQSNNEEDSIISKTKLLLVEGKDELAFFQELIKRNEILSLKKDDIQIVSLGGVQKFKTELEALKNRTGFENVKSMAIIRDADESKESALQSLRKILSNTGFSAPKNQLEY